MLSERYGGDSPTVDVFLMYAVLEHMTIAERLRYLRTCWDLLRPGGVIVIGDTPNRLTFHTRHTSGIPFYDWLPNRIAVEYASRSPRKRFRDLMQAAASESRKQAVEMLDRWGRGVSFHEFELVLGDLQGLIIGDGFDEEVLANEPLEYDEELLVSYFVHANIPLPLGFARRNLALILRKPDDRGPAAPLRRSFRPLVRPPSE